jgi:phosphatidate phosphatase APP1
MQDRLPVLHRLTTLFSSPDPIVVVPYRGFANAERLFLKGRVLEKQDIFDGENESKLGNFLDSLRRIETDEVGGAKLSLNLAGTEYHAETDKEGFFTIEAALPTLPTGAGQNWLDATIQLRHAPNGYELPTTATPAELLIPSANASFGIITDIDDTVLQTHVTSRLKLKMLYATLFKDSHQRLPMEGIPDLLKALEKGGEGHRQNPIFYVSDSPWNIYDLLAEFLRIHEIPKGPILLRDYGAHLLRRKKEENEIHKLVAFRQIMGMYPDLPFVMLGDTASKDADYYLRMAEEFEGRVLAIYIRQTRDTENARRIAKLIKEHSHIEAVMVHESSQIWAHAKQHGLVANR